VRSIGDLGVFRGPPESVKPFKNNYKGPKILKSFKVAKSICGNPKVFMQAPCLPATDLKLVLIHGQVPPVFGHHPNPTPCRWGPQQERLRVVIDGTGLVHIGHGTCQLQIRNLTIAAHTEELLVEQSKAAQDRSLCRVDKRQTKKTTKKT